MGERKRSGMERRSVARIELAREWDMLRETLRLQNEMLRFAKTVQGRERILAWIENTERQLLSLRIDKSGN